jgi:UDP:flavonoid glycosyltransferase YjiC (YdhE family)
MHAWKFHQCADKFHIIQTTVHCVTEYQSHQHCFQDLQTFLDEAEYGVIYFSLGSNVRSDRMPQEKRRAFLDAFSELPQRILWKWESDTLPGQPPNVKLGKWLPQQDILGNVAFYF